MFSTRLCFLLPMGKIAFNSPTKQTVKQAFSIYKQCTYEQTRGYKNFGHKPAKEATITRLFVGVCLLGVTATLIDWRWCRMVYLYYTGQVKEISEVERLIENEKSEKNE